MTVLGQVNDRQIIYIKHDFETAWYEDFPLGNWLLFAITNQKQQTLFKEISQRAIDKDIVYMCAVGQECKMFHDSFDNEIENREVESRYLPNYCILTTWDDNLEEGFWAANHASLGETEDINKIICLDLTNPGIKNELCDLINKLNSGWTPSET